MSLKLEHDTKTVSQGTYRHRKQKRRVSLPLNHRVVGPPVDLSSFVIVP